MGTMTTDVPGSVAGTKSKHGGTDSLENEAIGLDVAVRIHGSQVAAVVLDTTEHVEPFEEDTSTMIVFPRGAVVKLRARVRTGHAVVLTHLATKQTALCRIIQVNSAANVAHYVKLEFIQPVPGFWGVHFPSDGAAPAVLPEKGSEITEQPAKLGPKIAPLQQTAPGKAPAATQPWPQPESPRPEPKPIARESAKEAVKPTSPAPPNYGISEHMSASEVVPLATAPPKRVPTTPKPHAASVPPPSPAAGAATEPPIFDSLSTGEEIFGNGSGLATAEETAILKADHRATQAFARSLDASSLMPSVEAPKTHTAMKIFFSLAAAAVLAAGAAFYVRQYRGNARQNANVAIPASIQQSPASTTAARTTPSPVPAQTAAESAPPPAAATPTSAGTHSTGKPAPAPASMPQETITVTPVHSRARNADSDSHPTISNGLANIYAGDLATHPQLTKRSSAPVETSVPTINSAPKELSASSANAGLGSLVSGPATALPSPPKPAEPKPVARGGIVLTPRLLRSVQPSYPALAMSNHVEGDVQIQALIDQTGKVVSTKVISGPVLLRRAAMDAVQQWRYSPATLDGKPISMGYKVTVSFHLNQ